MKPKKNWHRSGRKYEAPFGQVLYAFGGHSPKSQELRAKSLISSFIRPFDLSRTPLLRVGLVKLAANHHILMIDMHHIISDGTSMAILTREFMSLYAQPGEPLPWLRLQYKDYTTWQNSKTKEKSWIKQEAYWIKQYTGEIPILDMPLDFPRPALQSFAGKTMTFDLDLNALEIEEKPLFNMQYCTKLFKEETIERYARYFKKIVSAVSKDSKKKIYQVEIISAEEKQQYPILLKGGKLAIPGKEVVRDIQALCDFIVKHRVTMITCSPQLLNELNNYAHLLSPLRILISGGDRLKADNIDNLLGVGEVYNTYGPTETTVCASYYRCLASTGLPANVPIGKPITNYRIYILDQYRTLLPVGAAGELCVAGAGVTRGYLNRPGLTAEKFDQDLWDYQDYHEGYHRSPRSHMSYIYRTGDLARWLPDGSIEFLGRIDHQVKIRGYRIELGEIESLLSAHTKIKGAAVLLREDKTGDKYLCAYIAVNQEVSAAELRQYLSKNLPDYMIPPYFITLEKIPLTPNGKVDSKVLPVPEVKPAVQRESRSLLEKSNRDGIPGAKTSLLLPRKPGG